MPSEFKIGIGLDPNYRIAEDRAALGGEKTTVLLSRFSAKHNLTGELVAKMIPFSAAAEGADAAFLRAAELLRDCYGKINYLVTPAAHGFPADAAAKIMKAYRKDIHVTAVTLSSESDSAPAQLPDDINVQNIDEFICVQSADAKAAAQDLAETESICVDAVSGAALFATKEICCRLEDKHARIAVLLQG